MSEWITNGLPPVGVLVEILMYSGNIHKDMVIRDKYGNYTFRDYVDKYVSAWRYIKEESNKGKLNNTNKKENKTMMKNTKENRVATMQTAGLDTKKYFSVNFPEGLKPGSSISIIINDDGQAVITNKSEIDNYNEIAEKIQNGYVRNTKLHRRWVMAQMFRMLNYKDKWSNDPDRAGYNYYLNTMYNYEYQFKMLIDELNVLAHLEKEDKEVLEERTRFFNKEVVIALCSDYYRKLRKYVETLKIKHCKKEPYVRIGNKDIFMKDIINKLYDPILRNIKLMETFETYKDLCDSLKVFVNYFVDYYKLPWNTPKCAEWKDAYKGAGAYYTMMNMAKFHNCFVVDDENGRELKGMAAVRYIDSESKNNVGYGYRLFAMMNKMIEDNNFNWKNRLEEIYSEKK